MDLLAESDGLWPRMLSPTRWLGCGAAALLLGCSTTPAELVAQNEAALEAARIQATYDCSGHDDPILQISGVTSAGGALVEGLAVSSPSQCAHYARVLSEQRAALERPAFVAVCDRRGDLNRFALAPNEGMARLGMTLIGDEERCEREAARANAPMASIAGPVARVDYACGADQFEIHVLGATLEEQTAAIPFHPLFDDACAAMAVSLDRWRDVREPVTLAVCDIEAKLHRFRITPEGKLTPLGVSQNFGSRGGVEQCLLLVGESQRAR